MDEQQYEDLRALIKTNGWKIICEYLENQIKMLQRDLGNREFESLSQVSLVQGKLQAYKAVLGYPGTRLELYEKKQRRA